MTTSRIVIALLLVGTIASAQDVPSIRLSLEEATARAIAASHRLAEARARAGAAEAAVAVRRLADHPVVGVTAAYTRTNHVPEFVVPGPTGAPRVLYPDVPNNYLTRLNLQWPIYTGGRTDTLELAARAEASAASADVAVAEADLRLEVARAFWALVTAQATAAVLDQSLVRTRAHLNDVRERFKAGLVPPNEVAAAEAQESRQRMLLIEARNQHVVSSAELARLIGVDLGQAIEPTAALELAAATGSTADALAAEARSLRHERTALQQRIEAADLQARAAAAGSRPTVALTGGVDYGRPNPRIFPRADKWNESWDAGVSVAWPLWDGGRSRAEALQASGAAAAARQRLAEFDSVLSLELRQRLLEIDSGRAAVAAASDAVRAATEARRVVSERYRVGVATQTDVLDADVALLQAELDRTRALAGVRFAEARLARASGR
jgi:outer membrane protein TolC